MIRTLCLFIVTATAAANASTTLPNPEKYDCRPDQECWPTKPQFDAFNKTVFGRLRKTVMPGAPCFPSSPDFNEGVCAQIKSNTFNATFRQGQYGAMESVQYEACGDANCHPSLSGEQTKKCSLGRMSSLYVAAQEARDIVHTLKFAKKHGIRLVVKNTGHDYMGRSSSANSLTLWTFNMKKMTYHSIFKSIECPAANGYDIGVIEAGVTAEEANDFFLKHNKIVTSGGCPSLGIAGGFGQGGGHGPLAPLVGLMVDQAVEFDVVTPDGQERTINECNEPDLFWAMRGGGGQSFAILTRYKFKLQPSKPFATWHFRANISANAVMPKVTQSKVLRDILNTITMSQLIWSQQFISGYDIYSPTGVEFLFIVPDGDEDKSGGRLTFTGPFEHLLRKLPDLEIITNERKVYPNIAELYAKNADFISRAARSGIGVVVPSRLVTRADFESESKQRDLATAMLRSMETAVNHLGLGGVAQISFVTHKTFPTYAGGSRAGTSVNPVWRDVVWQYATPGAWIPGMPEQQITAIQSAARASLEPVKRILSVQAAYMNEADPLEKNWQQLFYGKNYDRLVEIKKRYDPTSVLNCWKCIGFLEGDPMYSCYNTSKPIATSPKLFREEY